MGEVDSYHLLFRQILLVYLDHSQKGNSLHKLCKKGLSINSSSLELIEIVKIIHNVWKENPELSRTTGSALRGKWDDVFYPSFLESLEKLKK